MDQLKASLLATVDKLQQKVFEINEAVVETDILDPFAKFSLLTQQVLFEMEAKIEPEESSISSGLHEIIRMLIREDSNEEAGGKLVCMNHFIGIDFTPQLIRLSGQDSPKGYRDLVIRFVTTFIVVLGHKWLSNDEIVNCTQTLMRESKNEDSLVKMVTLH